MEGFQHAHSTSTAQTRPSYASASMGTANMTNTAEMKIPDDVMRSASEALYSEGAISWSPKHMRKIEVAVARAILAERTRCQEKYDAQRNMGAWKF